MAWASLEEALTIGWGIERAFVCPQGHSTNAHASVNSLSGWWYCYSCGAKGNVDLDRIDIDPYSVRRSVEKMVEQMNPIHPIYPETYLNLHDARGPGQYWLSRFGEQICRTHRLGQLYDGTCATIPMRDNSGRVLGVIRRDLTGQDEVKYRYPSGLTVGDYLYGYHRGEHDVLVLTEGATDSIAGEETGVPVSFMAAYGNKLSMAQVKLIRKYAPRRIIVAFDQDIPGEIGYARVTDRLEGDFSVGRLTWSDYKDLASIPLTQRTEMLLKVTQENQRRPLYIVGKGR